MKTISQRIVEGMAIREMKQIDIIEKTGINKGALSSYISGKYEPKQTNIYLIAKALNVSEAWLMGHDVPMEKDDKPTNTMTKREEEHLYKYRGLDSKGKHTVDTVLEMEYNRCNKLHIMPDAANAIEGATEADKQHDEDIMNDENF